MAESAEEMHHWITLLQRTKGDTRVQGQEFIIRGKMTIIKNHFKNKMKHCLIIYLLQNCMTSIHPYHHCSFRITNKLRVFKNVECSLIHFFWILGWLYKEIRGSSRGNLKLKKRWFVLTHNSVDYYKSSERNALKLGSLVLNSLCSVIVPDERVFKDTG